jgi:ABC-type transporter Mla MlaB component
VPDEVLRISRADDRPGLVIAGEIDESGYPVLLQSLAALETGGDVHVDLGGVEFCDLAGLRAIVSVGRPEEEAGPGRNVCLHAVPPRLRNILHILGWDETPGLSFDELPMAAQAPAANPSTGRADPARVRNHPAPDAQQPAC